MVPGLSDRDCRAAELRRRELLRQAERARFDPFRPTDPRFQPIAWQAGPRAAALVLAVALIALAALVGPAAF
jgi:hypothetical protein